MIGLVAFVLGALWGAYVARKRGGNRLDVLQYAAVHGIILALVAIVVTVIFANATGA
jgi:hypothetical protein